jgi:hypothetical protein
MTPFTSSCRNNSAKPRAISSFLGQGTLSAPLDRVTSQHLSFSRHNQRDVYPTMASETINFGQIFAVAVVGFLLYRWFSGPVVPSSQSSGRNGGRQVNPEHVEQVAQMYPQLDRRAIIWDLHRNGGSVQATIERLLGGRSLETVHPP